MSPQIRKKTIRKLSMNGNARQWLFVLEKSRTTLYARRCGSRRRQYVRFGRRIPRLLKRAIRTFHKNVRGFRQTVPKKEKVKCFVRRAPVGRPNVFTHCRRRRRSKVQLVWGSVYEFAHALHKHLKIG